MNKILILGSAGQIGSHLTKLLSKKYEVIQIDLVYGPDHDLRSYSEYIKNYINESDFVMFLAFDVGGSYYLEKYQNTFEFIDNNIKIMNNVFGYLKESKKPFIFTSTQMSNMIDSPYGILKTIGEFYTKSLNGLYVKFWNVYGVEKDDGRSHVITDFILMAKRNKHIKMRTNGIETREFLHSDDAAKCLEKIMLMYNEIDRNQHLHISSFVKTKIIDLAILISKIFNCTYETNDKIDNIQFDKNNEPEKYILNFWKPEIELENGIKNIIEWMKE